MIVIDRVDIDDIVDRIGARKAHGDTFCLQQDPVRRQVRDMDRIPLLCLLQRPALEQVDHIRPVRRYIDRIFDVHRVGVGLLQKLQDPPHIVHELPVFDQAVAGDIVDAPVNAPVREGPLRIPVMGKKKAVQVCGNLLLYIFRIQALHLSRGKLYRIDQALGELVAVGGGGQQVPGGVLQHDHAGIGAGPPVHGRRPQAHDQAQHALAGMVGTEAVGADGISDPCRGRHIEILVSGTRDPLDQNGHLFIPLFQAAALAVVQGGQAHGAGIYRADGIFKGLQPFFQGPCPRAEDRLVLARKSIAETVLQDGTGPHDDRVAAVILQEAPEFRLHGRRKGPVQEPFLHLRGQGKIPLLRPLLHPQIPEAVVHDIGVKDIRPDVKGVMGLDSGVDVRPQILRQLAGQQHPRGLAADHARPDHAVVDLEIVLRRKMLLDQVAQPLIPGQHDVAHAAALLRHIQTVLMLDPGPLEKALPAVHGLVDCSRTRPVHLPVIAAHLHALPPGRKRPCPQVVEMGLQHLLRLPPPDLERADIHGGNPGSPDGSVPRTGRILQSVCIFCQVFCLLREDIQKELGRIPDLLQGIKGVPAPQDGKIGHRIQNEKEGTGQVKEVPHEQVRRPGGLQLRQAVKNIEGIIPLFFNDVVDLHRKGLKPVRQGHPDDPQALHGGQDGVMLRKADIE